MNEKRRMTLIKLPYWIGIGADLLWAAALLFPSVYGWMMQDSSFAPDMQVRLLMAIGGILMLGWTILLAWGVRRPIERRAVILITGYPVVLGLLCVSVTGLLVGSGVIWLAVKTLLLLALTTTSYILAGKEVSTGI